MADNYNTIIDQGSDWFRNFLYTQPAVITNAVGNGTTVTYTAENGFSAGQTVYIEGILPSQYNLGNVTLLHAPQHSLQLQTRLLAYTFKAVTH